MAALNSKVRKAVIPVAGLGTEDAAGHQSDSKRNAAAGR